MEPLLDIKTDTFLRGTREGKTLEEVAKTDYTYLTFLVFKSSISEELREHIENWLIDHPEYRPKKKRKGFYPYRQEHS